MPARALPWAWPRPRVPQPRWCLNGWRGDGGATVLGGCEAPRGARERLAAARWRCRVTTVRASSGDPARGAARGGARGPRAAAAAAAGKDGGGRPRAGPSAAGRGHGEARRRPRGGQGGAGPRGAGGPAGGAARGGEERAGAPFSLRRARLVWCRSAPAGEGRDGARAALPALCPDSVRGGRARGETARACSPGEAARSGAVLPGGVGV